jgi:hypothetical protein
MQLQVKVMSAVVNSRVLRSGDDKGQTKYSVDLYVHTGDMVPSKFVVSGLGSEAEAQAIAAKFPHNAGAMVNLVPRDALWLDARDIQPVTK